MVTDTFHGVPIELTSFDAAVDDFLAHAVGVHHPEAFRLVNSYSLALASRSPEYLAVLRGPGINLPDGKPLAAFMRRVSAATAEQVRGPSFFEACLDRGRQAGVSHFFLGTTEATLEQLSTAMLRKYSGLQIAGTHSPPFRPLWEAERQAVYERIRTSGADVVWVGLGTPKQDFEARRIVDDVAMTAAAVGAAFDFSAGTKRTSPRIIHRFGLEWLFRLLTEPRRLGRRYVVGNTVFIKLALQERRARAPR